MQTLYDVPRPQTWRCQACGAEVGSEDHAVMVQDAYTPLRPGRARVQHEGQLWEIWFTPASRYWNEKGVFCSAQCSLNFTRPMSGESELPVPKGPLPAQPAST